MAERELDDARTRRSSARKKAVCLAALAAVSVCFYLFADAPLARLVYQHPLETPHAIRSFMEGARHYGQDFSVIMIFALMLVMDRKRRREAMLLALAILTATFASQFAKMALGRARPHEFIETGRMWEFLEGFAQARYRSLPSAHAATAFALSAVLSRNYPRGRAVFFAAAVLCAAGRVIDLQHFLSDVFVGATFGLWIGRGVHRWRWSAKAADFLTRAFFPVPRC